MRGVPRLRLLDGTPGPATPGPATSGSRHPRATLAEPRPARGTRARPSRSPVRLADSAAGGSATRERFRDGWMSRGRAGRCRSCSVPGSSSAWCVLIGLVRGPCRGRDNRPARARRPACIRRPRAGLAAPRPARGPCCRGFRDAREVPRGMVAARSGPAADVTARTGWRTTLAEPTSQPTNQHAPPRSAEPASQPANTPHRAHRVRPRGAPP